jgi:hypothetical protein
MKKYLILLVVFAIQSCADTTSRALNTVQIGMGVQDFLLLSKNKATIERSSEDITVYRYQWASPDSYLEWNTTFYYFRNGILVQFDGGVRTSPPPQLRLNYNLN